MRVGALIALLLLSACSPEGGSTAPDVGQRGQEGLWHISLYNTGAASRFWQLDTWLPSTKPGIYELTRFPDSAPTVAQVEAARVLRRQAWQSGGRPGLARFRARPGRRFPHPALPRWAATSATTAT